MLIWRFLNRLYEKDELIGSLFCLDVGGSFFVFLLFAFGVFVWKFLSPYLLFDVVFIC